MSPVFSVWRLAARIANDPGPSWTAALSDTQAAAEELGQELAEEVTANGLPARFLVASTANDIEGVLAAEPHTTLVTDVEALTTAEWQRLDRARDRLEGDGATRIVFVMTEATAARGSAAAPNLWSFLAGAVHRLVAEAPLPAAGREGRLAALREHYAMSDADIVTSAEKGSAPRDPYIAEWLILLGRSDLVMGRPES